MTDSTDEPSADAQEHEESVDAPPHADLILVQVSDDLAMAFGSESAGALDIKPMLGLTDRDRSAMRDAAALAVGGLNAVAALNPALESAMGLVRLTAETQAALATLAPMTAANGANLGTLVDSAGHFAHSVQWVPTAAGGLSVVAAMGPSIASLAIQMQLREISKKLDTNIALTRDVLDELHWDSQSEFQASVRVIVRAWGEAQHLGHVSDHVYREISGKETDVEKVRSRLMLRMNGYLSDIAAATRPDDRRGWINEKADQCVNDLEALSSVHTAWLAWTAMRIDHVRDDPRHAEMLREEMTTDDERARKLIVDLADHLQRELGLIENASGRRVGRFNAARQARARAVTLRAQVMELVPMPQQPDQAEETLLVGDAEKAQRVASIAALLEGRHVVAAAVGSVATWWRDGALLLTDTELLITTISKLLNDHEITERYNRADIRYVRVDLEGRIVDIATTKGFRSFHGVGSELVAFTEFARALQSSMHLPSDEMLVLSLGRDTDHSDAER